MRVGLNLNKSQSLFSIPIVLEAILRRFWITLTYTNRLCINSCCVLDDSVSLLIGKELIKLLPNHALIYTLIQSIFTFN